MAIENTVWAAGQNIRYKLVLPSGAEAISFTPLVGNWDEAGEETQNPA